MRDGERMAKAPHPLPVIGQGQPVHIYLGAGWAKGTVHDSTRDRCVVWLAQGQRAVTCYDARNLRR